MRLSIALLAFILSFVSLSAQPELGSHAVMFHGPFGVGKIAKGDLTEASGIVASRANPGVLWTHNDSGDEPRVYGLAPTGNVVCTLSVKGAKHIDWEDIAVGPGPEKEQVYVYAGDIGDNNAVRSSVEIYRFVEPKLTSETQIDVQADVLTFTYPDGARDAEALLVDPVTGDIYIISKRDRRNRIYRAAAPHAAGSNRPLRGR